MEDEIQQRISNVSEIHRMKTVKKEIEEEKTWVFNHEIITDESDDEPMNLYIKKKKSINHRKMQIDAIDRIIESINDIFDQQQIKFALNCVPNVQWRIKLIDKIMEAQQEIRQNHKKKEELSENNALSFQILQQLKHNFNTQLQTGNVRMRDDEQKKKMKDNIHENFDSIKQQAHSLFKDE